MSKILSTFDLLKIGRTNLYHSDEERRLIHEAICNTEEALQRVHAEQRVLKLQEKALQSDLARYHIAQAPIKRLPDNVLRNIFECQDVPLVYIPLVNIPSQITISHVCSAWRQIMLETPAFWCSIIVYLDSANNGEVQEVAHAWLSRAKSLPCSVDIIYLEDTDLSQDWHRNIVKNFISPHKFKHLAVTFADYHLRDLLQLPDVKLRCIENLHLDYMESSNGVDSGPFELHKLPSLTSFDLQFDSNREEMHDSVTYKDVSRFANTPWHQLKHIKIRIMLPVLFCLRMLELSSDVLETCLLEVGEDDSFISPPSSVREREPIHCSQLRELEVNMYSTGTPTGSRPDSDNITDPFLCSLRCPKLKSLALGQVQSRRAPARMPGSINLQTLLKMQHISGMHLEKLMIGNTARNLEVLPLLAAFPSLMQIVFPQTINFTGEAMEKLGSGTIGPSLKDLIIKKRQLALEKIFEMIKARSSFQKEDSTQKHKPTPFKSVTLYGHVSTRRKCEKPIEEIRQLGVKLHWYIVHGN